MPETKDSHKSSSRKRHRSRSRSESNNRSRRKTESSTKSKQNTADSDTISKILSSVQNIQEQFVSLTDRVLKIESHNNKQPLEVPHSTEVSTVEDDRLSVAAAQAEEDDSLINISLREVEDSNTDGLDETSLVGFVPPLDDLVSPVVDIQSHQTRENIFFDPEETTTRRWSPTEAFGTFIEKNFRRRLTTDQVNEIIGEYSPPETDAFVAPMLDKSILNYIPSSKRKFTEQRDKDLALIQRATLNAAAPLCCLHDRLESNETISNEELRTALQRSLCLLGSSNHITTTLRRKKILAAINPDKVQLAEQDFPKAGKMLFGEDLTTLAAKQSELTRSLSKNLQKPSYNYGKSQSHTSDKSPRYSSHTNTKYNRHSTRGKFNRPFRNFASNSQRLAPEANQVQNFRAGRDQTNRSWPRQ